MDQGLSGPYNSNFTVVFKAAVDGKALLQLSDAMGRQIERKILISPPGNIIPSVLTMHPCCRKVFIS
jgi:hypothetical protein